MAMSNQVWSNEWPSNNERWAFLRKKGYLVMAFKKQNLSKNRAWTAISWTDTEHRVEECNKQIPNWDEIWLVKGYNWKFRTDWENVEIWTSGKINDKIKNQAIKWGQTSQIKVYRDSEQYKHT